MVTNEGSVHRDPDQGIRKARTRMCCTNHGSVLLPVFTLSFIPQIGTEHLSGQALEATIECVNYTGPCGYPTGVTKALGKQ